MWGKRAGLWWDRKAEGGEGLASVLVSFIPCVFRVAPASSQDVKLSFQEVWGHSQDYQVSLS